MQYYVEYVPFKYTLKCCFEFVHFIRYSVPWPYIEIRFYDILQYYLCLCICMTKYSNLKCVTYISALI